MCRKACIDFGKSCLREDDIKGKSVIEVGALDVNGSLRSTVESFAPGSYIGVDIQTGPGVDIICDAGELVERFGRDKFDLVIATEMLEHVRDWRRVISNLKNILKTNGIIFITVPTRAFRYHGYPFDFWRYEEDDIKNIFSDFAIELIGEDTLELSVFMRARKRAGFNEKGMAGYQLYSIITGKRAPDISDREISSFKFRHFIREIISGLLPGRAKNIIKKYCMKNA
jgi:SAM-dependent methyltransferase